MRIASIGTKPSRTMQNAASDLLFVLREVPDTHLAEFLCERVPFRAYRGVTFWRLSADGSYVWTRDVEAGPFRIAKPNKVR